MFLDHPKYGLRPFKRHSIVVTVGGLVYVIYGFLILATWAPLGPRASAVSAGLLVAPLSFWALLFIFSGAMAILSSRWPVFNEKWGYVALCGMAATWMAAYLGGLFFDNNTLAETGGALVWGLVAFLWWGIAGLMNPDKVVIVELEVPVDGAG